MLIQLELKAPCLKGKERNLYITYDIMYDGCGMVDVSKMRETDIILLDTIYISVKEYYRLWKGE